MRVSPPLTHARARASERTHRRLPVVCGRLLKGLVELELDLGGFEGALGLHAHGPLVVHAHH